MSNYIIWCCDYNKNTGEGRLAEKFISSFFLKKRIKILYPKNKFFLSNYFYQIYGIFVLWFFFLLKKKTVYLNYLPLWNFLIYLLSPPNTIFGPITGSIQINKRKKIKSILRLRLFPILYKISLKLLYYRTKKIIFATNVLSKFIDDKTLKKTELNFILKDLKYSKNKSKKKINLIVYYRKHENKFFDHHIEFIKEKLKKKEKVIIVGDKLNIEGVSNFGRIKKKKIFDLIRISKYALSGDDNLLSFFNIDCIQNNVKVIFNYKLNFQKNRLNIKQFVAYNFEKKKFVN